MSPKRQFLPAGVLPAELITVAVTEEYSPYLMSCIWCTSLFSVLCYLFIFLNLERQSLESNSSFVCRNRDNKVDSDSDLFVRFKDNAVLLVSLNHHLQLTPENFTAECEGVEMSASSPNLESRFSVGKRRMPSGSGVEE